LALVNFDEIIPTSLSPCVQELDEEILDSQELSLPLGLGNQVFFSTPMDFVF